MRKFNADAIIALVLLVASAELYRETFAFRAAPFATMSTSTWPRFVLILLGALSLAMLFQSLSARVRAEGEADPASKGAKNISHRTAAICFGLFAAFLAVTPWLGMLIAGILYVFIMQEVLGPRDFKSRMLHLAIAVVSVGGMWAVFTFALRVMLPAGNLFRL